MMPLGIELLKYNFTVQVTIFLSIMLKIILKNFNPSLHGEWPYLVIDLADNIS